MGLPDMPSLEAIRPALQPIYVVPAIIVLVLALLYRWSLPRPLPGIPYDKEAARSPLGHLPEILAWKKEHDDMRGWFLQVPTRLRSPIVQIFIPFQPTQVLVTDFWETHDITLRRTGYHKEFDRGPTNEALFGPIVPENHVCMETTDPRYKGNMALIKDLMVPAFLHEVSGPSIYEKVRAVVDFWKLKTKISGGRPFAAYSDIHQTALDIILVACFGLTDRYSMIKRQTGLVTEKAAELKAKGAKLRPEEPLEFPRDPTYPELAALIETTNGLMIGQASPMPSLSYWWAINFTSLGKAIKVKEAFIIEQVKKSAERLQSMDGDHTTRCAMDHIVAREIAAAAKAEREPVFLSRQVLDELFGYFIGGHDTTSTTLCWGIKFLTDNQDVQARLRTHLRTILRHATAESRQPSAYEIIHSEGAYLDAVIEEITRCAGTFPMIVRETRRDNVLVMGYPVPKDTVVLMVSNGQDYLQPGIPAPGEDQDIEKAASASPRPGTTHHRPEALAKERIAKWDEADMATFAPRRWLRRVADVEAGRVNVAGKPRVPQVTVAELDAAGPTMRGLEFDSTAGPCLPFGAGVRGCFGKRLAFLEMRIVFTLMVWNFELQKCAPELSTYKSKEAFTRLPRDFYVKLRVLGDE